MSSIIILRLRQVQTHGESGQRCSDVSVLQTSSNSGGHQRLCWLQGQFLQRVFQVVSSVGDAAGAARTYPAYTQLQTQSKTFSIQSDKKRHYSIAFGSYSVLCLLLRFWRVQNTTRRNCSSTAGPVSGCSVLSANWDASTQDIKSCRWPTRTRPWRYGSDPEYGSFKPPYSI